MSPASTTQIIVAKLFPLFVLLCLMGLMAVGIMRVVFGIPFRGDMFLGAQRRGSLSVVRHQHRHVHRHVHEIGAAGAAHAFFRKSAADFAFRRVHAGGGDAEMAAAGCAVQSDPALRADFARRDGERKRHRHVVAKFSRAIWRSRSYSFRSASGDSENNLARPSP